MHYTLRVWYYVWEMRDDALLLLGALLVTFLGYRYSRVYYTKQAFLRRMEEFQVPSNLRKPFRFFALSYIIGSLILIITISLVIVIFFTICGGSGDSCVLLLPFALTIIPLWIAGGVFALSALVLLLQLDAQRFIRSIPREYCIASLFFVLCAASSYVLNFINGDLQIDILRARVNLYHLTSSLNKEAMVWGLRLLTYFFIGLLFKHPLAPDVVQKWGHRLLFILIGYLLIGYWMIASSVHTVLWFVGVPVLAYIIKSVGCRHPIKKLLLFFALVNIVVIVSGILGYPIGYALMNYNCGELFC